MLNGTIPALQATGESVLSRRNDPFDSEVDHKCLAR